MSGDSLYRIPHEVVYDGRVISSEFMKPQTLDAIKEMDTTENDVFVTSYPRSGNHSFSQCNASFVTCFSSIW